MRSRRHFQFPSSLLQPLSPNVMKCPLPPPPSSPLPGWGSQAREESPEQPQPRGCGSEGVSSQFVSNLPLAQLFPGCLAMS